MNFNKEDLLQFIRDWFNVKDRDSKAIIEITSDKNTLLCIELLAEALGKERVVCVSLPNIEKTDIEYEQSFTKRLGVQHFIVPISATAGSIYTQIKFAGIPLSTQAVYELPFRIKFVALHTISNSLNGFVVNPNGLVETLQNNGIEYSSKFLLKGVCV